MGLKKVIKGFSRYLITHLTAILYSMGKKRVNASKKFVYFASSESSRQIMKRLRLFSKIEQSKDWIDVPL